MSTRRHSGGTDPIGIDSKSPCVEPDETDRLVRTSRVFARAIELFEGNSDNARRWLTNPVGALGGRTPLDFASTDVGAIEVENLIGRLEYGIPT